MGIKVRKFFNKITLMISRNKAKFIKSLQLKKFRKAEQAFVVEGSKSVLELINAQYRVLMLLASDDFIRKNDKALSGAGYEIIEASPKELGSLGSFQTSADALVVAETKPNVLLTAVPGEYMLVLDDIRDPGNLGTIIRIADWYGFRQIVASETSAELYNPKVLQASMGSFTRINVFYSNLTEFFPHFKMTVYGACLQGRKIHEVDFARGGAIVIGNESHGISVLHERFIDQKIAIPRYGHAESLNAAVAAAVICDNLRAKGS